MRVAVRVLLVLLVCALAGSVAGRTTSAQELTVPISVQVELLARVLWYERSLQASREDRLGVLILVRARNNESLRAAAQLEAQLARAKLLGGKTLSYQRLMYETPEQVKKALLAQRGYLIYVTPGLEDVLGALAGSLKGTSVLTVSTQGGAVQQGTVLGFELVSSKSRIVVNLSRARAQNMDFSAQLLRIAQVIK